MSNSKHKPRNKGGRPRIEHIPATAQLVLDGIAEGLTRPQACKAAGMTTRTFDRWVKRWPELRTAMAEAKAKHRQARVKRALEEVAAARQAKLAGEAPIQPPQTLEPNKQLSPTESTDAHGRIWRIPSVSVNGRPLAPGEVRWFGLEVNDLNTYRGSRNPKHEEVFIGLDGKRCNTSF